MQIENNLKIFSLSANFSCINGYIYQIKHSTIAVGLDIKLEQDSKIPNHSKFIFKELLGLIEIEEKYSKQIKNLIDLLDAVLMCQLKIFEDIKYPIFDKHKIIQTKKNEDVLTVRVIVPSSTPELTYALFCEFLELINLLLLQINDPALMKEKKDEFLEIRKTCRKKIASVIKAWQINAPMGLNTYEILKSAFKLSIPFKRIIDRTYVLGEGIDLEWFDSSSTSNTGFISSGIAKNKEATIRYLNLLRFPHAKFRICKTLKDVEDFVDKVGFPIALKPPLGDGGVGVFSNLLSHDEIEKYFNKIKKISKTLLAEEHIFGADFRITMHKNKIIDVFYRISGGVTGDGIHNITELVEIQNNSPEVKKRASRYKKANLNIDEEAKEVLEKSGLNEFSIPKLNEYIKLRRQGNVSTGGRTVPVKIDEIHPDNIDLFMRLSRDLNLVFMGIDFLIPDIKKSWKTQKCSICEINNQPQIGITNNPIIFDSIISETFKKSSFNISYIISNSEDSTGRLLSNKNYFFKNENYFIYKNTLYLQDKEVFSNKDNENEFKFIQSQLLDKAIANLVVCCNNSMLFQDGIPSYYRIRDIFFFELEIFENKKNIIQTLQILDFFSENRQITLISTNQIKPTLIEASALKTNLTNKLKSISN